MNKIKMLICCQTMAVFITCGTLMGEAPVVTEPVKTDESVKNTSTQLDIDTSLCTKDVLMTFFPQPIVKAILIKHDVSADKAETISKELSLKSQDVAKIVESKATKMDPNPFNDLSQRDAAVKLFRSTLFEVFSQSLKLNGITKDDNEIQSILDDMQEAKGKLFVECIKKEHK